MESGTKETHLVCPSSRIQIRRACAPEKEPAADVLHQIIDGDKGRVEDKERRQLLERPPPVEQGNINGEPKESSQEVRKVIGVDGYIGQRKEDEKRQKL